MDDSMGRRTATGIIFSRSGCSITFKEQSCQDKSIRYCSRLGCSASIYSRKATQEVEQENSSMHPSSSKSVSASGYRKPQQEQRSRRSREEADIKESSNIRGESGKLKGSSRSLDMKESVSKRILVKKEKPHTRTLSPLVESAKLCQFTENAIGEVGSCSRKLSSRTFKEVTRQPRRRYKENSSISGSTSNSPGQASHDMLSGLEVYDFENRRRSEISDVVPSGFNADVSGIGRIDDNSRKRSFRRESSYSSGKNMISPSNGTNLGSSTRGISGMRVSIPEHLISHQAPRRSRNQSTSKEVVYVRTRRTPNGDTRTRPNSVPNTHQSQSKSGAVLQSSARTSTNFHPFYQNLHGQPGSSTQIAPSRPTYETLANGIHILDSPSEDSDGYPCLNMEGVAEELLEIEGIEQDEELTYEQLSVLRNHLFLNSLSFHDQYRDMRMDIDNMTYEELLALEEKMGTVSTALTEEVLSRCLKRSNYMPASLVSGVSGLDEGDVKCSICQEEFVIGVELGKLACEHNYHVTCIHQWLRLKNWCPICKASVSPAS